MMPLSVSGLYIGLVIGMPVVIMMTIGLFLVTRYKRCPSNRLLVIYGKVSGNRSCQVIHGGGALVMPVVQDYMYLSLEPFTVEINLDGLVDGLDSNKTFVAKFTTQISIDPKASIKAAERLLGKSAEEVVSLFHEVVRGRLSLLFDQKTIDQLNSDRQGLNAEVVACSEEELGSFGMEIIAADIPRLVSKG